MGRVLADRFEVIRKLGSGGMGEVYEAHDRKLSHKVAVKRLPSLSPHALYLFKSEFRGLQGFSHPNVVELGELFEAEGEWFFSMELVKGTDLITYIRGNAADLHSRVDTDAATIPDGMPGSSSVRHPRESRHANDGGASYDEHRLRYAIAQLADAVSALHGAGKIHRDIKPSNVLVGSNDRLVLLDFGLIADHTRRSMASHSHVVGTAEYMAPEQASESVVVTPSADCYSIGVILFEALTRRLPFQGPFFYVITAKQATPAPDVHEFSPECPPDLAKLCKALLSRNPADRPEASAIAARIRPEPTMVPAVPPAQAIQHQLLVGREAEIGVLETALADVQQGKLVTVVIQGESGIGKSSLVRSFLENYRASDRHVVLAGRCYEKELVPFKAFDEVVDALSHYLRRQPKLTIAELLPRYVAYLCKVFPVIARVEGFDRSSEPPWVITDPHELRHRAFSALREIFSGLGEQRTVIVHIDDFQWADQDSMLLLSKLLGRPDPPRMLLLVTSRQPVALESLGIDGAIRTIDLGPLSRDKAALLAHQMVSASLLAIDSGRVDMLIEEAQGHPYFITELVRHIQRAADKPGSKLGLDEAIWARVMDEDQTARRILQYVCVAGIPIAAENLRQVCEEQPARFHACCTDLVREYLIRSIDDMLVPYHDRVREAVVKRLTVDELQQLHARLATVFERHPDLALQVRHLEASGQHDRAAQMAVAAARKAREGLAFEQAASLYRHGLRLDTRTGVERCELLMELGAILVAMGKGLEASEVYTEAAGHGDPAMRLACNIQIAHQLLISGHLQQGLLKIRDLFAEQRMAFPATPTYALLRIVWHRILLSFRKLRRLPAKHREPTPTDRAQLALYEAAIQGLVLVDPIRAAFCVGPALLQARRIGNARNYLYFLLLEGDLRKAEIPDPKVAAEVVGGFDELYAQNADSIPPSVVAVHKGARIYTNMCGGDTEAVDSLISADEELAATGIAPWEFVGGRTFLLALLRRLGRYSELRRRFTAYVLDAKRRNDVYTQTTMRGFCNLLYLIEDDPRRAREELASPIWISTEHGFHVQHWYAFNALMEIHIYEGVTPDSGYIKQQLAAFRSSQLGRLVVFSVDTYWLLGRIGLAFPEIPGFGRQRIRSMIRRLERTSAPYPKLLATQLRAGLAHSLGDDGEAIAQLRSAINLGKGLDMRIQSAAASHHLGTLVGGEEGEKLRERARATLTLEGVRDPARLVSLMIPGFSSKKQV